MKLPGSPEAFAEATWEDIRPYYEDLATCPLGEDTVEEWLGRWSRLEELVTEAAATAMIAYTVRTDDPAREAAHLRFSADILPQLEEQDVRLARRLPDLGYRRDDLDLMLRRFLTHIE
ncbi:MAG: hypothetical protein ACREL6_00700, partial [Gemmatimonadales bacterium]